MPCSPNLSPSFPTQPARARRLHSPRRAFRSPRPASPSQKPLASATSYEHLSAIRSTHPDLLPEFPENMFQPFCTGEDSCGFASESHFDCQECSQRCEDASCSVELTSECTDQCVVVACNDAHHGRYSCGQVSRDHPCEDKCQSEFDCDAFVDHFVSAYSLQSLTRFIPPLNSSCSLLAQMLQ